MTLVDFIALRDDVIDLSSDEEIVQEDHIVNQHRATLLDTQAIFVLAGQGSQGVQAVFVVATEGRRETTDSRNALEATASSLVMEKSPLDMDESQNCPRSATSAPLFHSPTATTPKALTSESGHAKLVRAKVKCPRKNYHTSTPRRSPRFQRKRECCNSPVEELAVDHKRLAC